MAVVTVGNATAPGAADFSGKRLKFIIGFGVGPGLVSYTSSSRVGSTDRENNRGVATAFHIGGVIGDSFELYYMNKLIFWGSLRWTGVHGVGATYPLNSDFSINGGIGSGLWEEIDFEHGAPSYSGLGLLAGGRYQLNESGRWMLNLDIMYTKMGNDSFISDVLGAQLTINAMSH